MTASRAGKLSVGQIRQVGPSQGDILACDRHPDHPRERSLSHAASDQRWDMPPLHQLPGERRIHLYTEVRDPLTTMAGWPSYMMIEKLPRAHASATRRS